MPLPCSLRGQERPDKAGVLSLGCRGLRRGRRKAQKTGSEHDLKPGLMQTCLCPEEERRAGLPGESPRLPGAWHQLAALEWRVSCPWNNQEHP